MRLIMTTCALLLLTGCPVDPGTAVDDGAKENFGAPPTPGGEAGAPPAGGELPADGARPSNARFEVAEGEGVTLSGSITYPGSKAGQMRVDFLTLGENSHPQLVHAASFPGPGPFSMEVPKDFGELHMVAFIDVAGDGPSPTDPAAKASVTIGGEDVTDVALELSDEPDLGELTPGGAPDGALNSGPENPEPAEGAEGAPMDAPGMDAPPGEAPEGANPAEGAPPEAPTPADAVPAEGAAEGASGG